jgi:acylpyruvate hydrolase
MKIICIGRNYHAHIEELNNAVPDEPVLFIKPETALLRDNEPFIYPPFSTNIHYEAEVVIHVAQSGKNIPEHEAAEYYDKIGLGIDFTARDIQDKAKQKGLPWFTAKGFDGSAVISELLPKSTFKNLKTLHFQLDINKKPVQKGDTALMIHSMDAIITAASKFVTLLPGDLIMTGTPAGVGPIHPGDCIEGYLENRKLLDFIVSKG